MESCGAIFMGLTRVCVPGDHGGGGERKRRTGLNSQRRLGPPTGLIIPDCLFSTFCCHGDGLNRDSPQIYALCSPDACPHLPAGALPANGAWATE